jgi:hypothetical protein
MKNEPNNRHSRGGGNPQHTEFTKNGFPIKALGNDILIILQEAHQSSSQVVLSINVSKVICSNPRGHPRVGSIPAGQGFSGFA